MQLLNRTLLLVLFLFSVQLLSAQQKITLENIYLDNVFTSKSIPGFNVMKNGISFSKIERKGDQSVVSIYDLKSGKHQKILYTNPVKLPISDIHFNKAENKILIFSNAQNIYRRSILYNVYIVDLQKNTLDTLFREKVLHARFNPDGTKVAYVYSNNLFVYDLQNKQTIQITSDGKEQSIINGNCDWVYEEEFGFSRAFEWSGDGNYLAYYKFDESKVKEFTMTYYDDNANYPRYYTFKYPKAGEANSLVSIHTYHLPTATHHVMQTGSDTDIYIPRIKWASASKLIMYRLNRLQNKLEMLMADPSRGDATVFYEETNQYYIDINDNITFINDGNQMVFTSEMNGFNHLYLYDGSTKISKALTSGSWDLDELVAFDENKNEVYYTAGKESPLTRQFYKLNIKTNVEKQLTNREGLHQITPCQGLKYFVVKHQSIHQVPTFQLADANGKKVRVLEENLTLSDKLKKYNLGKVEFFTVPNAVGINLNAYRILPPNFDEQTKYPVLMYQYSGPGSQQVLNKMQLDSYFWHQYLAQEGYIIVVVDGTGTGGRGEEFKKKTYLQLGNLESNDQIDAAKHLASLPYVDANRIGIWGWSYGGFMSSTCILKAPDLFKAAIAVAPVTNWRFYDNIYTERYMRTPQENPKGYDDNAPEKMAANLKGSFLLIHGLGDDNVHFQNAAVLTNQLIKNGKQFQSEYYPNGNHGIGGGIVRYQLYQRMTQFIKQNL